MYKFIILIVLALISGCKDKYEKALDAVIDTSMSVRKCQLKHQANEKPNFPCGQIEHNIAIEEARMYGIKENRIEAAVNSGKLQVNKISPNLIRKVNYLKNTSEYKASANLYRADFIRTQKLIEKFEAGFEDVAFWDTDWPYTCRKIMQVFPMRTINKDYSPAKCKIDLEVELKKSEAASIASLRKANEWQAAANKINSEY